MPGFDRLVEARRNWLGLPELRPGLGRVAEFLGEQVAGGEVLLHGSNSRTITRFEPRQQTSYHGAGVQAVFATTDPVWPLYFAVTDTERAWSRWNMCLLPERSGAARTRYFFSVGAEDFPVRAHLFGHRAAEREWRRALRLVASSTRSRMARARN